MPHCFCPIAFLIRCVICLNLGSFCSIYKRKKTLYWMVFHFQVDSISSPKRILMNSFSQRFCDGLSNRFLFNCFAWALTHTYRRYNLRLNKIALLFSSIFFFNWSVIYRFRLNIFAYELNPARLRSVRFFFSIVFWVVLIVEKVSATNDFVVEQIYFGSPLKCNWTCPSSSICSNLRDDGCLRFRLLYTVSLLRWKLFSHFIVQSM